MNILSLKTWSERQQVLAVILMAGILISTLWFFLLLPKNQERRQLERDIDSMQSQLASKNYLLGEDALEKKMKDAEFANRKLSQEWAATAARIAVFANAEQLPASDIRHIDFKVALFDVRSRLLQKSRAMRVGLPHDLGIQDTVDSSADARTLMLQLRTVERLVDLAIDLKITMLRQIVPLPPLTHATGEQKTAFIEEYPVELQFYGTRDNLYDLLRAILEPEHVFILRRLRVEAARGQPGLLSVQAELSALILLLSPEKMDIMAPVPSVQGYHSAPMGH